MTQVVGSVYNGSTAATTHSITVPSGVTTGMTGLFVIGTGSSDPATTTLSRSGSSFAKLDERNAVNTRVAIWTGTGLAAGNTVTLSLSTSQGVTVAHYYQDDYTFVSGSLSAAIRSVSAGTTTSGAVTPASGQRVVAVAVERTTTATTLVSATSSGGEAITNITYGEGTGTAQASAYAGTFVASAASSRTATISYSNNSGNGYAALILTTPGTSGGGGGGGGGGASTPGALHNIGKGGGLNHFNLGIGFESGHTDITENALEAGYISAGYYELAPGGTGVLMKAPLDGGTTSANTQYPRVEYRELQPGGVGDSSTPKAAWNGNVGTHYMRGRSRVLKMPPNKPQLVLAQTHDADDDTSMIRLSSKTKVEFKLGDEVVASAAHVMGQWYDWEIRVVNGDISWYWGNLSTPVASRTDGHTASGYYFKFGCYAQSNDSIDSVSDGPFIVEVAPFPVTWHTGYAEPSIPSGSVPTVGAGDDASVATGSTFGRTATENSGSAITSRSWKIQSGPTGVGTTIDSDQNLSWTPTVAGFYVLRYSATNATGTGFDDVGITVATVVDPTDPGDPGTPTTLYQEKFLDGVAWPVVTRQNTVVNVASAGAFGTAISAAASGQRLTLSSASFTGTYSLTGKSNVTIEASTLGGPTLGAGSQLTIKDCENILIRGLNWTTDSALEAINIRGACKNIWIDQCTIGISGDAVNSANSGQFIYISDTSELVRIGYSWLRNKGTAGNLIKVYGNDAAGQVNKHILVDHNVLEGVEPELGNGKEPVRHGVSTMSKSKSYSTYCMNLWVDNAAEPENFSGKAGGLLVYGNTFLRCAGGAVLRHGLDCVMADNYFIDRASTTASNGLKSGGIRYYDSGHDITNNYFDGLIGSGFQSSLLIDRGDAEGSSTALANHWRVIDSTVDRNVIVNSQTPIVVWNGSQYSMNPSNVRITNNISAGTTQAGPIVYNGTAALVNSPAPSGNLHYATPAAGGFVADADGIFRKDGYGPRLTYIKRADVGPGGALYGTGADVGTALSGGSGPVTPTAPQVNAGADTQVLIGSALVRTATEVGSSITARKWTLEAGPGVTSNPTGAGRPLIGWGGNDGSNVTGVTNEIRGAFMNRSSWAELQGGLYLDDTPGLSAFLGANPQAAVLFGVPLIPHDLGSSSGWNALLDEAISGSRDAVYTGLGRELAQHTPKTCYARIWWEFNVTSEGSINATKFKAAWARAIPLIRSGFAAEAPGKVLKIVFNSMPDRSTKESHYPGSAFVDVVSYDVYGKTYGSTNQTKAFGMAQTLGYLSDLVAWGQSVGKPVAMDEWGNWQTIANGPTDNRGYGDWPEFITAMFDWAVNPANNVQYLCYFNEPGGGVGVNLDNLPQSKAVFVSRSQAIQSQTGTPTGTTLSTTAALNWTPSVLGNYVLRYSATNSVGTGIDDIAVAVTTGGGGQPATAPTFVGIGATGSGESAAVSAPPPAGVQAGDFELGVIISAGAETISSAPSNWSLMKKLDVVSGAGDPGGPCTVWLYSATSNAGTASWTKSGTRVWHAVRIAYRGLSAVGAVASTVEATPSTSHPTPAVLPASATARVVGIAAADYLNATVGPFTAPAGWVERYDVTVTSGTENESIVIADIAPGAVSTTGTFTSALADEAGVLAVVLEGPLVEQAIAMSGIAPLGALGSLTVSTAGPAQSITLPSLLYPMTLGRFTVTVAAGPQTIQLRGIPPR